ncbi:hypothetical protein Ddye_014072 [Dipteronia dyeriana]|uniref:Uncharacterized protein n=1 Tax=Dipteronia dyeriana TaxID=168575 RepID=A0AAD9X7R0_9ROSI|nr:hypothetical protein Ddye_014072 [Dipteronia dyeriana]
MSHGSGGSVGSGPDFHLSDEVLAVIPTDPYDQLDLARKITSMAIASRVTKLESEVGRMKQKLYEKDRVIYELEERLTHVQKACQESDSRLKIVVDDNMREQKAIRDNVTTVAQQIWTKVGSFGLQLLTVYRKSE